MIFFDTETCGFHGPTVLIQYAYDDGPIQLWDVWYETVADSLQLIEDMVYHEGGIVGFNLAFDWFHICQTYTTLSLMSDPHCYPINHIAEYVECETKAINGLCLKPVKALDLMLHARKGPFQSTMDRNDIRIKRIPTVLADELCDELCKRIELDSVYFSRRKDDSIRWQVVDIEDEHEFKDIVLKFAPSAALKVLAKHALGVDDSNIKLFHQVDVPKEYRPNELGWAPYASAVTENKPWPLVIREHARHWRYNERAREYGSDDVTHTRNLYRFFDSPDLGDIDSVLSCMVASCRWRGYSVDHDGIRRLRDATKEKLGRLPFNPNAQHSVIEYLRPVMSEFEMENLYIDGKITTKKIVMENIAKWKESDVCEQCMGMGFTGDEPCNKCEEGLIQSDVPHPAAKRAQEVLDARENFKEMELYNKLLQAQRFHASFKVIGTLSGRMAGADGLNAQGIKRATYVRNKFPLAHSGMQLDGGDFAGFEVAIADAVYQDPDLRSDLLSGKKIHGLFGQFLFPNMSYDQILESKGLPGDGDKYTRSKNGVFALFYGGEAYTLSNRVGVSEEVANNAYHKFVEKYKVVGEARKGIIDKFCSMRQPNGIGTRVEWNEPDDYIESLFGFRRYFTLENKICKALFELAEKPPKPWLDLKIKVKRRERIQTAAGACRSALFAAAFAQQGSNMRAAGNHVIQSTGATLTKMLQARLWELQPAGIAPWKIQPFNVHDEVMCPIVPELSETAAKIVSDFVEEHKSIVPLLEIEWEQNIDSWEGK